MSWFVLDQDPLRLKCYKPVNVIALFYFDKEKFKKNKNIAKSYMELLCTFIHLIETCK